MKYILIFVCILLVIALIIVYKNTGEELYSYYSSTGSKTFLLLHGIPGNEKVYDNLKDELESQGYGVIIPHLIGSTVEKDTEYVSSLITKSGLSDIILVVHDRGGLVGIPLLKKHPDEISEIFILDTILEDFDAPFPQNVIGKLLISALYSDTFIGDMITKATLTQGGLEKPTNKLLSKNKSHVRSFFLSFNQLSDKTQQNKEVLKQYSKKVTVIWGEDDPFLPKEIHLKNTTFMAKDSIHILSGGMHYIPYTHAQEITSIILGDTDDSY